MKRFIPFNSIKSQKSDGSNEDNGELLVVPRDLVVGTGPGMTLNQQVFSCEDEPEAEEEDVEESLSKIGKEGVEEWEIKEERKSFKRKVELSQSKCKKS